MRFSRFLIEKNPSRAEFRRFSDFENPNLLVWKSLSHEKKREAVAKRENSIAIWWTPVVTPHAIQDQIPPNRPVFLLHEGGW